VFAPASLGLLLRESLMLVLSQRARESQSLASSLPRFTELVDRRLAIAEMGLAEARQHLAAGQTDDVEIILEKLDEDLHLLRHRLRREFETTEVGRSMKYDCAN
jgi:hypothetical protein